MSIEEALHGPIEWFHHLPTAGKIAVGVGGAVVVLLIWRPWHKQAAASVDSNLAMSPAYTSVPDYSSGGVGGGIGGGTVATGGVGQTTGGVGQTTGGGSTSTPSTPTTPTTPSTPSYPTSGGNGDTWGGSWPPATQIPQLPSVPDVPPVPAAPVTPVAVIPPAPPSSPTFTPAATIQAINDYMRANPTADPSTTAALHQQKVSAASALGYTVTPDGYIIDPSTQQYAPGIDQTGSESPAAMAIHRINEFVATNYANLTASQISQLHDQKVAAASSLGYSVDSGGDIRDSFGNLVQGVGWQTTNIADYHNASMQTMSTPSFYGVPQPTTAPPTKNTGPTSPPGTYGGLGSYYQPVLATQTSNSAPHSGSSGGNYGGVTYENPSTLYADQQANQGSQVVDGHVNPYYNSGKTVTQAQYNQLSAAVAQGGAAAQAALSQLSGARVVG